MYMYLYLEDIVMLVRSKFNAIAATICGHISLNMIKHMHLKQFFCFCDLDLWVY